MKKLFSTFTVFLSVFVLAQAQNTSPYWSLSGNSNATSSSKLGTTNANHLRLFTNNLERMRISSSGNIGIGKTGPNAKLHLTSATGQDALRVQVNSETKLFVHRSGGVAIGSNDIPPANGLFVSGNVGIGTTHLTVPGTTGSNYKVKILHGDFGFVLENSTSGNDWELFTHPAATNSGLVLFYNGFFRGTFNAETGAYSSNSDERLKTNIKPLPAVLDKVNQLKPAAYQFKTSDIASGDKPDSYGFLAQEVIKIFPHLVTHTVSKERNLDQYTLDYSGFGVIAIKAIQELQQTNEELKQIIQQQQQEINALKDLKDRVLKLEAAISSGKNDLNNLPNAELTGANLQQNQPNPFNQITSIHYSIPPGANAQILIYDASGKLVKTLPAPADGQVQLNTRDLKPGTYVYSLLVDGKLAGSKQMILAK